MSDIDPKKRFKGIGALVLTIFDEDRNINIDSLKRNVDFMVSSGIDETNGFLILNGSTGECYALTMEERKSVIEGVIQAADGRVPVMAGCNDNSVKNVIELVNFAERKGAQAAMMVQPFYLNFNDSQIYKFYEYINDRVSLPIMLYNNPSVASGSDMSIDILKKLSKLENVFALKETTSTIKRFFQAQVLTDDMLVFSGSSSLQPFADMAKMSGFISFLSSFNPHLQINLWQAIRDHDYERAQELHTKELELYDWWWRDGKRQTFGQIVHAKKALDLIGLDGGYLRPPLLPMEEDQIKGLKRILDKWELL